MTPLLLVRLDYTFENDVTAGFALTLALVCVIAALPFLAGGIVVALAIKGYVAVVGRLYAFDLAGAALGALRRGAAAVADRARAAVDGAGPGRRASRR